MSSHHTWSFVLALTCIALPQAEAQRAAPGAKVRVIEAATARPLIIGELVRLSGDTATILTGTTVSSFIIGAQHRLQVSVATRRKTGAGIGLGLLIGGGTGALIGLASYQEPSCGGDWFCFDFGPGMSAFGGSLVGGLAGLVIGGAIGAGTTQDVWGSVSPAARGPS